MGCLARRTSGHRQAERGTSGHRQAEATTRVLDVLRCASSVQLPERWGKPPRTPLRCGTRSSGARRWPRAACRRWTTFSPTAIAPARPRRGSYVEPVGRLPRASGKRDCTRGQSRTLLPRKWLTLQGHPQIPGEGVSSPMAAAHRCWPSQSSAICRSFPCSTTARYAASTPSRSSPATKRNSLFRRWLTFPTLRP